MSPITVVQLLADFVLKIAKGGDTASAFKELTCFAFEILFTSNTKSVYTGYLQERNVWERFGVTHRIVEGLSPWKDQTQRRGKRGAIRSDPRSKLRARGPVSPGRVLPLGRFYDWFSRVTALQMKQINEPSQQQQNLFICAFLHFWVTHSSRSRVHSSCQKIQLPRRRQA